MWGWVRLVLGSPRRGVCSESVSQPGGDAGTDGRRPRAGSSLRRGDLGCVRGGAGAIPRSQHSLGT